MTMCKTFETQNSQRVNLLGALEESTKLSLGHSIPVTPYLLSGRAASIAAGKTRAW